MMTIVSKLVLVLLVLCVTPNWSYADEQPRVTVTAAVNEIDPLAVQPGVVRSGRPPGRPHNCCNKKRAMIGAAIGAAGGFLLVQGLCAASDCTSAYVGAMGFFGGIGAAIGAFVDTAHRVPTVPDRRVRITGVVSPTMRAVLTTVRLGEPRMRARP
jgi:hypothetical protein